MENPLYVGIAAASDVYAARERGNSEQWEPGAREVMSFNGLSAGW
jgi:hypothetical protein